MTGIPLLTGPQDVAQMQATINALIIAVNALGGGPAGGMATTGTNASQGAINNIADAGAANGVDLTIAAGTVTAPGTVGYYYGPKLNLRGGATYGGYAAYGGAVIIEGGSATGSPYNTGGYVNINGGSGDFKDGQVNINGVSIIGIADFVYWTASNEIKLDSPVIETPNMPGTPGNSGTLYFDAGAGNVVKRVP